jgi:hypothetical protein
LETATPVPVSVRFGNAVSVSAKQMDEQSIVRRQHLDMAPQFPFMSVALRARRTSAYGTAAVELLIVDSRPPNRFEPLIQRQIAAFLRSPILGESSTCALKKGSATFLCLPVEIPDVDRLRGAIPKRLPL